MCCPGQQDGQQVLPRSRPPQLRRGHCRPEARKGLVLAKSNAVPVFSKGDHVSWGKVLFHLTHTQCRMDQQTWNLLNLSEHSCAHL